MLFDRGHTINYDAPYDYLDNDRILTMPAILKNFYVAYHRSLP